MHLGVLALPGDGGHLTDFVANLWSIGAGGLALVTLIIQAKPKPWFFKVPSSDDNGGTKWAWEYNIVSVGRRLDKIGLRASRGVAP